MPNVSDGFFERFAVCFDEFDAEKAADFYHLPTVIMNDTDKHVFTRYDELVKRISELMQSLKQVGVIRHQVEVSQSMRLADNISFCNVRWRFFDEQENRIFSCMTSYTLQKNAQEKYEIIVAVIDDEEKQLAELLNSRP